MEDVKKVVFSDETVRVEVSGRINARDGVVLEILLVTGRDAEKALWGIDESSDMIIHPLSNWLTSCLPICSPVSIAIPSDHLKWRRSNYGRFQVLYIEGDLRQHLL